MEKSHFYREAASESIGPLEGTRVIEVTTTWAGPMCGCLLGDFGADVIKVELAEGEVARRLPPFLPGSDPPLSFAHATVNRNKRSLSLDLRVAEARDLLLRLVEDADIFVENFRPGTLASWGLGYEDLRRTKADIIYVSITGFGQFGPDHDRPGYDPLAQAAAGVLSLNGEPDGPPVKAPTFFSDDLGGLHGALCALAALHHRDRTGEGQHVDVALLDATLFQSNGFLTLGAVGAPYPRMGNEYLFAAPANAFSCKDGAIYLGALLDKQWAQLAGLMGRPELATDPDFATAPSRIQRRDEVNALTAQWCAEHLVSDIVEAASAADLPVAPVRSYADAARDPHVAERDMLQHVRHGDGPEIPLTGPAGKFSRTPTRVRSAAPETGQHDADILGGLGLSKSEVDALRKSGAIGA